MICGRVKWFDATKGYGFIERLDGGDDVFVHIGAVKRAGLTTLIGGEPIEFEEVRSSSGIRADNLRTLSEWTPVVSDIAAPHPSAPEGERRMGGLPTSEEDTTDE